jgi:hypothetical protein
MNYRQATALFIAAFLAVAAWILLTESGQRLPYLVTPWATGFRAFVVYPFILLVFWWFAFRHRWRETGLTGYQMRMLELESARDRRKQQIGGFLGLLLLPAGIAWLSVYPAAWAAGLLPSEPYEQSFVVMEWTSRNGGYDLGLSPPGSDTRYSLFTPRQLVQQPPAGEICVQGRSSLLGTRVYAVQAGRCR